MRVTPPTIFNLLDDPIYRAYMKHVPPPHPLLGDGDPWQVWARFTNGKWRTAKFHTYADAWRVLVKHYRMGHDVVGDVAIVSRRVFYGPPGEWRKVRVKTPPRGSLPASTRIEERWFPTFTWDAGLEWCGRCRRPTVFRRLTPDHHALRRAPALTVDEPFRCQYCGIRQAGCPSLEMMEY